MPRWKFDAEPTPEPVPPEAVGRIVAVTWYTRPANPAYPARWEKPALVTLDTKKNRMYWSGGPTYMPIPQVIRVLKVFPGDPEAEDGDAWEAAEVDYCRTWPILPEEPALTFVTGTDGAETWVPLEGFISPEGGWYPVEHRQHESTAWHLNRQLYEDWNAKPYGQSEIAYLKGRGWVEIHADYLSPVDLIPTAPQNACARRILGALQTRRDHPKVLAYYRRLLERWPMPEVTPQ